MLPHVHGGQDVRIGIEPLGLLADDDVAGEGGVNGGAVGIAGVAIAGAVGTSLRVRGKPLSNVTMPLICQPPAIA